MLICSRTGRVKMGFLEALAKKLKETDDEYIDIDVYEEPELVDVEGVLGKKD